MSILSWNCQGLGLSRTVQELIALVREKNPTMVFLAETRRSRKRAENLRWRLGLKNCLSVDSIGRGGGQIVMSRSKYSYWKRIAVIFMWQSDIIRMRIGIVSPTCMVNHEFQTDTECGHI